MFVNQRYLNFRAKIRNCNFEPFWRENSNIRKIWKLSKMANITFGAKIQILEKLGKVIFGVKNSNIWVFKKRKMARKFNY